MHSRPPQPGHDESIVPIHPPVEPDPVWTLASGQRIISDIRVIYPLRQLLRHMANSSRYIEVVEPARVVRTIESYRTVIGITVTTRRTQSCLEVSLKLRDRVITALKNAGLTAEQIEEGGGHVSQQYWSSAKTVVHELRIVHPKMSQLVEGISEVERVFATIKDRWFSGVRRDFSVNAPTPEFADTSGTVADAMKQAMQRAKLKATSLAQEAGVQLGALESIVEEAPLRPISSQNSVYADDPMLDDFDLGFSEMTSGTYTPATPAKSKQSSRFRIRFSIDQ